ncbi:MAG TPA: glycosyltransferase family 39 protein [Tepidisphaeraceae bacterium]|nr:glycosyltransferase family 39 protein [Tepidisphaeraceae bacterium]
MKCLRRHGHYVILGLILLLAGLIRFHALGRTSFWLDEFLSLRESSGGYSSPQQFPFNRVLSHPTPPTRLDRFVPWWKLWHVYDSEINPPLYFIALRIWRQAFGDSELAVRSLSALMSVAAVLFFYLAVSIQTSRTIALWAAAILAVAGPQIYFAQTARNYAMWMMLAMAAIWIELAIEKNGPTLVRLTALAICTLAMLLTHYFAALSVAAMWLYALLRLRGRARWEIITVLSIGVAMFLILWGGNLPPQMHAIANGAALWTKDLSSHPLLASIVRLLKLPLLSLTTLGQMVPAAIAFFVIIAIGLVRSRSEGRTTFWLIWLGVGVMGVLGLDLISHKRLLEIPRYTFVSCVAIDALIPILSQKFLGRRWWVGPLATIAICLVSLPRSYPQPTEWRDLATYLQKVVQPNDVVVYTCGQWQKAEAVCLFTGISHYAPDLPGSTVVLTDIHSSVTHQLLKPGRSIWMICFQPDLSPRAIFPNAQIQQQMLLPNVGRVSQLTAE